jgi:hypothetical protein
LVLLGIPLRRVVWQCVMMTPEARVWGVTGCLQEKSWAFACQAARDTYFYFSDSNDPWKCEVG